MEDGSTLVLRSYHDEAARQATGISFYDKATPHTLFLSNTGPPAQEHASVPETARGRLFVDRLVQKRDIERRKSQSVSCEGVLCVLC